MLFGEIGIYDEWRVKLSHKALLYLRNPKEILDTVPTYLLVVLFLGVSVYVAAFQYLYAKFVVKPIVVPEKSMNDFIKISLSMSDEILFLEEVSQKLREGQKVRIAEGPFKGVEGRVVRIKKSRRVMVELPGMLAVTTNYIPVQNLELL